MADTRLVTDYPALARHRAELRDAARNRIRRLAVAVPTLLVTVVLLYGWSPPAALLAGSIGGMLLFFLALPGSSSIDAGELAGIEGEVAALERLAGLPETYRVLNRVRLPDPQLPNGVRELDFVVAGPTGLWVVEVKNTPGLVQVVGGARHWALSRCAGCSSVPSWNAMDNPERQVRDQLDALSRWMLMQGISVQPQGLICLAHPEVAIRGAEDAAFPVVVPGQLVDRIRNARAERLPEGIDAALAALRPGMSSSTDQSTRPTSRPANAS